jgi:glutathione S-transferase
MANSDREKTSASQINREIVLYYSPGACSLAVHIVLEELDLPYELKLISVSEKETSRPEFLKINPKGRVPVLRVGDTLLTEAPAILVHVANMKPASGLFPAEPLDSFRCLEWLNWLSSTVHAVGYGQLWRPERFTNDSAQFEDIVGKGSENIADAYRHIEKILTGRVWSVGESYSCADPFLLVFYLWGSAIGFAMQDDYPGWSAHAARVLSRDAVRRAMEQEGLTAPSGA